MERELGHPGLTGLHVAETMHQRKQPMAKHSNALVLASLGKAAERASAADDHGRIRV